MLSDDRVFERWANMTDWNAAYITDIHAGPDWKWGKGTQAFRLLDKFAAEVLAHEPRLDALIDGGDNVNIVDGHDVALANNERVNEKFNRMAAPSPATGLKPIARCDNLGNHDIFILGRANFKQMTGHSSYLHAQTINGLTVLSWNPGDESRLGITDEALDRLASDLDAAPTRVIMTSHVPVDLRPEDIEAKLGGPLGEHYQLAGAQVRHILERSGKVILCLAGHVHDDALQSINGIHYYRQKSLVDCPPGQNEPEERWAFLTINDRDITITAHGLKPPPPIHLVASV